MNRHLYYQAMQHNQSLRPAMNAVETDENFQLVLTMPGFDQKDIKVQVKQGKLEVSAERKAEEDTNFLVNEIAAGSLERTLVLPESVDTENIDAAYKAGLLTLTLPKLPNTVKTISIN